MKIRDLSNGERLLLQRRRDQKSQREVAADHGVSYYCYGRWELDQDSAPSVALHRLMPHESCFIRRRRAGISLSTLADTIGISRWWLCKMEYGKANADRLVAHWAQDEKPWRPALAVAKA